MKKPVIFINDRYIRVDLIASVGTIEIPDTPRWGLFIRMRSGEEHVFFYEKRSKKITKNILDTISKHFDVKDKYIFPELKPLPRPEPKPEVAQNEDSSPSEEVQPQE